MNTYVQMYDKRGCEVLWFFNHDVSTPNSMTVTVW